MRITNSMLINNMISNINKNLINLDKYQQQLATGKKIQVPSDDPVIAARALKLRTDVSKLNQYKRNIDDAKSWLEYTDSILSQIGDVLHRARELAVEGANGTMTPEDMMTVKEEIEELKTQLIHLSNSSYAGRYIFSGFSTDKKLLDENGAFALDMDSSQIIRYEIGVGDDININVPGNELFNMGGTAVKGEKGKLIKDMDTLIAALESADGGKVRTALGLIDENFENILMIRADAGARHNRLELTKNRVDNDIINFVRLMSENEDVDMAETVMRLSNEEYVYRASLAGGARIIQPSLVDFLR
ncbi:MAG TPA: flagellar hook-associated protein FlgL [Clostridiaceae bacterium]|nr:flagellar hook-associated protein FlgL [Clostridiaceae bacterium]